MKNDRKKNSVAKAVAVFLLAGIGLGLGLNLNLNADEPKENDMPMADSMKVVSLEGLSVATFAGGCFWCVESDLEKVDGVAEVISGYSGGKLENPTYKLVSSGKTEHIESVQVYYDKDTTSYEHLLDVFFKHIDPTDSKGSFFDRGPQYRPAVFYNNDAERDAAQMKIAELDDLGVFSKPLATEVTAFSAFYKAEDYHQDYYKRNPLRYKYYRHGSGRDKFVESIWGKQDEQTADAKMKKTETSMNSTKVIIDMTEYTKPSDSELRDKLTRLQYKVTQKEGTESPFDNAYWDNHDEGIYVDITTGEPLFSSIDKYESGTGWPSFSQPINAANIVEESDYKFLVRRTEVRSKSGDAHLGHVFTDGPAPTGLRYCLNSAALEFVSTSDLKAKGYGQYASLFEAK